VVPVSDLLVLPLLKGGLGEESQNSEARHFRGCESLPLNGDYLWD
jgi:hypothetical protein